MNQYFGLKIPRGSKSKKGSTELVVAGQIGRHLRGLHEDVVRQPVPGRFLELLRQLEGASSVLPAHAESLDGEAQQNAQIHRIGAVGLEWPSTHSGDAQGMKEQP